MAMLPARGLHLRGRSSWYESAPVPPSGQPWFVNAVLCVDSELAPGVVLQALHDIEAELGRRRDGRANAARPADLDLLDYKGRVGAPGDWPRLPHPRLHERTFVLMPLAEVAPDWRHPVSGRTPREMLARLRSPAPCNRLPE